MVVVKVNKRRIYIPKEIPFKRDKAILIPFGKGLIVYPVPHHFTEVDIPLSTKELKKLIEKKAREDALMGLKR